MLQIASTIKSKRFKYRTLQGNVTLENKCKIMRLNTSIILKSRKAIVYIKIGLSCSMSLRLCTKIVKVVPPFLFKQLTELCWPDCFPWYQNMLTFTLSLQMVFQVNLLKSTSDGVQEGGGLKITSGFLLLCQASVIWQSRFCFVWLSSFVVFFFN